MLIILFSAIFIEANCQYSKVLYYMKLPQNHLLNPAIKPTSKIYIGLPVVTGIGAEAGNDFLKLSDIIEPGMKIDSSFFKKINLNRIAGNLKDQNTITTDASIQLFGLGLTFGGDLYVFADIIDKFNAETILPRDLLELYVNGYENFVGRNIDLSGMNFKGQYFREYGLGFSKNITSRLRVGVKGKLLSGIASMSFDNRSFTLKVNNDFSQTVTSDASLDVSGRGALQRIFNENNVLFKSETTTKTDIKGFAVDYLTCPVVNTGFSADIGIVYNPVRLLTLSASVTDLGYITWKKDLKSFKANNSFNLAGITLQDVANGTFSFEKLQESLIDTIKNNFIEDPAPRPYKTYLPTGITAGASLNLLSFFSLGFLSESHIYSGVVKEAVTLSANAYLGRVLSASMSYTVANYSYNNIGAGLALKTGPLQFYVIADKIPLGWDKAYYEKNDTAEPGSFSFPKDMNLININVGLNIIFGKLITKKTDKPMIIVD